jgi:hypothetical protein
MAKVAVVLDEQEQVELKVILSDGDGAEALRFLKEVVWAQVQATQCKELRPAAASQSGSEWRGR